MFSSIEIFLSYHPALALHCNNFSHHAARYVQLSERGPDRQTSALLYLKRKAGALIVEMQTNYKLDLLVFQKTVRQ